MTPAEVSVALQFLTVCLFDGLLQFEALLFKEFKDV